MSELIKGLYPKEKHENAPDYVDSKLSINVPQFREWMQSYLKENPGIEWINIENKFSKAGNLYSSIDDWKPGSKPANEPPPAPPPAPPVNQAAAEQPDFKDDDIPF